MARDTRRRFEAEAAKMRPQIRAAFLQAIADIKRTADMDALITALERGDVAGALAALKLGPEYFAVLDEAVRATYAAGGNYALSSLPKKNPATGTELVIRFQGRHPRAETWLSRRSSNLIVEITAGQRTAIREVITRRLVEGVNPKTTALDLVGRVDKLTKRRTGGIVGLTSREALAVENYRLELAGEGRKADQIDRMVSRYSNKLLRVRGERIARTETIASLNAGRDEGMNQLIESGEVSADAVTGTWDSSGDGRVRDSHAEMDGQTQPQGQPFQSPVTGALMMHPGDTSLGAGGADTINCRCYKSISVDYFAGVT
ncbi:phage head morphogenesis protein [Hoeflea sp. G2-23]|uniref:Phage head morphogenesis protein n=1 Tax=Hoeflea algicola TaxID=2983763 RepID=A0ABT3ZGF5_9HYPH|nr:phage minor head protein [Hoeflea algicola]MCY0150887.1 phage head morphogenesis protein [Hoeflea algicola]